MAGNDNKREEGPEEEATEFAVLLLLSHTIENQIDRIAQSLSKILIL
jgi:hypothetical protein